MLFSPLNTTAALCIEPSLFTLPCHFCNRAKWHSAQETICPHPGAGARQAQTDPGLCCPKRRYLGLPFDARPLFPPHCRAAARRQTSPLILPGRTAGGTRFLFSLPHARSPTERVNHPPKSLAGLQPLLRRGSPISDLTVFRRFRAARAPPKPARALRPLQGPEVPTIHSQQSWNFKAIKN